MRKPRTLLLSRSGASWESVRYDAGHAVCMLPDYVCFCHVRLHTLAAIAIVTRASLAGTSARRAVNGPYCYSAPPGMPVRGTVPCDTAGRV